MCIVCVCMCLCLGHLQRRSRQAGYGTTQYAVRVRFWRPFVYNKCKHTSSCSRRRARADRSRPPPRRHGRSLSEGNGCTRRRGLARRCVFVIGKQREREREVKRNDSLTLRHSLHRCPYHHGHWPQPLKTQFPLFLMRFFQFFLFCACAT